MANFKKLALALATAGALSGGAAQADLFDRGGGLIYDSDLNITWLSDANYAKTSGYDADGAMNWSTAMTWAGDLVYHDSVRNVNYSDWRLYSASGPNGAAPCIGYCTAPGQPHTFTPGEIIGAPGEMGHLFFAELHGTAGRSILYNTSAANYFINVQVQGSAYWSSTLYAQGERADQNNPYHFHTDLGYQDNFTSPNNLLYAWAVRDGDVYAPPPPAVTPVPEPEIYAMMGLGLGLMGWAGRRRKPQAA